MVINKNKIHQKEAKTEPKTGPKTEPNSNGEKQNRIQGKYYLSYTETSYPDYNFVSKIHKFG